MSQPCPEPQLPQPVVPNQVEEEKLAQSSTNPQVRQLEASQPEPLQELPAKISTQPQAPQPEASQPEPLQELPAKISTRVPEHCMYKNRLQEYAQKSSISLPIYQTVNEGAQHMPMFRSTVLVDDVYYTSPLTFSSRKAAEQDAAKVALDGISNKIKHEGCPIIYEDTIFCKSVLNEYAAKMNLQKPIYTTTQAEGLIPIFVSSLVFEGITYAGPAGRNKKEAEQLAARTVIQSILGNSDSRTVMSEIVKSKSRLYDAVHKVKDKRGAQVGSVPAAANPGATSHNGMPAAVIAGTSLGVPPADAINVSSAAIPVSGLGFQTSYPVVNQPFHEFKKRKAESSLEDEIAPPIAFVPPVMEQSLLGASPTSGKKKNRKGKKKAKKAAEPDNQLTIVAVPLSQLPPCSVAQ